ncbi:MAG: hypothetical protein ABI947_01010 [Chloroflexota bacterium]
MSPNPLEIEIMDTYGQWTDVTTDTLSADVQGVGLVDARTNRPRVGRANFVFNNLSKAYSPDANSRLDVMRRIRVKASGSTLDTACRIVHEGAGDVCYLEQQVNDSSVVSDVFVLQWDARAQFDSQYNSDIVWIEHAFTQAASGVYTYTNKWQTYTLTYTNSGSFSTVGARFFPHFRIQEGTFPGGYNAAIGIEYRNITLKKNGGTNLLSDPNIQNSQGGAGPWIRANFTVGSAPQQLDVAAYDISNRDGAIALRGASGATTTLTIDSAGVNSIGVGYVGIAGGSNRWTGQSFIPTANGQITQFTAFFDVNTGSPIGAIQWEIRANSVVGGVNTPAATALNSGTFVPVPSSNNTVTVTNGTLVATTNLYWLLFKPAIVQTATNAWSMRRNIASVYANGDNVYTDNGGVSWAVVANSDLRCTISVTSATNDKLAQAFTPTVSGNINKAFIWLRKTGSPTGTITLRIETDSGGLPSGVLANAALTNTFAESGLTTSYASTFFPFATTSLPAGQVYWLVISTTRAGSATNYVEWGVDYSSPSYAYSVAAQNSSVYFGAGGTAIFDIQEKIGSTIQTTPIRDYWIVFNGIIQAIQPAPFANAGLWTTAVVALDFTTIIQNLAVDLPLQKNQTLGQLAATLFATLPSGTLTTTMPGKLFDSGQQTFQTAFDGYTKENTTVLTALADAVTSEFGRCWFDLDGTLRVVDRVYIPKRIVQTVVANFVGQASGVTGGKPIDMTVARVMDNIINSVILTAHPRSTGGAVQVVGQIETNTVLPPRQAVGTPSETPVTLTFRDIATGKIIGADAVITPLVPDAAIDNSDFYVTDVVDSSGNPTGYNYTLYGPGAFSIVSYVVSASQLAMTLRNLATGTLYVTKLQVRGLPIYTYDPVTTTLKDATSIALYQERTYTRDLVFANDTNFSKSLAQYFLNQYKNPFTEVTTIALDNQDQITAQDLLGFNIGDVVQVTDNQAGITQINHMIVNISFSLDPNATNSLKHWECTLERLDQDVYGIFGNATYGKFGTGKFFV